MVATRELIEGTLWAINEAENSLTLSPAEKSAAVDPLHTSDVRTWTNGLSCHDRAAERAVEAWLFSVVPDYRREFEQIVIDPPLAAFTWRITGTNSESGLSVEVAGASVARFDDRGRMAEVWLYYNDPTDAVPPQPQT
jgi:SnoaL-like domain